MGDAVDACLTKAFRDVAVPDGLAERLLAGLAVDSPAGGADGNTCLTARQTGMSAPLLGREEFLPHRRRWLLLVGGLVAAAATIVLAVWLGSHGADSVSGESAGDEAIRLFNNDAGQAGSLLAGGAAAGYPFSSYVRSLAGTKWRQLNDFLGYSGVVYNLPGPPGAHAALYVVACDDVQQGIEQSPASPRNVFTTAGCCASAWQEGGLLYVLVVEGDPSNYERYLNLPSSPVV
jgi:hypothetical protein